MNARLTILWCISLCTALMPGLHGEIVVELQDGERFTGTFAPGSTRHWDLSTYWAPDPIPVPLERVSGFQPRETVSTPFDGMQVFLVGGSKIWLDEVRVEGRELQGRSSWGQWMRIPFPDILRVIPSGETLPNLAVFQSAIPQQQRDTILVGNQVMADRYGQAQFQVEEWPEQFLLDVEIRPRPYEQAFEIRCHGADSRRDAYFIIRCYQDNVRVTVYTPSAANSARSVHYRYPLREGHPVERIRVRGDVTTGDMVLQVGDGEEMSWEMGPQDLFVSMEEQTPGIIIQNRTQLGALELMSVRLQKWSPDTFPPIMLADPGVVLLNGGVVAGRLEAISGLKEEFRMTPEQGEGVTLSLRDLWEWIPSWSGEPRDVPGLYEVRTERDQELVLLSALDVEQSTTDREEVLLVGTLGNATLLELPLKHIQSFQKVTTGPTVGQPVIELPVLLGLLNGDLIRAEFKGMTGSSLDVALPWAEGAQMRVHGSVVRSLRRLGRIKPSRGDVLVEMTNGCRVVANLKGMNEEQAQLQPVWADEVSVDRKVMQSVYRRRTRGEELDLLTYDLQEWTLYADGSSRLQEQPSAVGIGMNGIVLKTAGVYMRDTKPIASDHFHLRVRLSGQQMALEGPVRLEVNGFANEKGRARNLTLQLMPYQIRAQLHGQGGQYERWSTRFENRKGAVTEVNIELNATSGFLRVDCGEGRVWKYPIQEWKFHQNKFPLEIRVGISGQSIGTMLRHMTLSEQVDPAPPDILPKDREPGNLLFRNGDRLQAELVNLEEERAVFQTPGGGSVELPMDRIQYVFLKESDELSLRKSRAHARFILGEGEEQFLAEVLAATPEGFTVRREGIDGGWMIPFSVIRRVEFNPYTP